MKTTETIVNEYNRWLKNTAEDAYMQRELLAIQDDPNELAECFGPELAFGTSGLRGIMGPGPSRLNRYVVRRVTQGLADYINGQNLDAPSVVISYDSRLFSQEFAEEAARVLSGNDIKVWLFDVMTPVPILSYAIGRLTCDYGIMITASHNTGVFNGYKVYNHHGYQILSPEPEEILAATSKCDFFEGIKESEERILKLDQRITNDFISEVLTMTDGFPDGEAKAKLKLIYTPLNGTGNAIVRRALAQSGFRDVTVVPAQENPDPDFTTCKAPNPEKVAAYNEAFRLLDRDQADLIIATDPDCDRVGCALTHKGTKTCLTGNQIAVLMLDFLCQRKPPQEGQAIWRSIVSTPLADRIAAKYGLDVETTLTGFKYIGEKISKLLVAGETNRFYFGFEESNGFLMSPFVRDKDGVSSAVLIAEMAAWHKKEGRDLIDRLEEIREEYGNLIERTRSFTFKGLQGRETMTEIMRYFREEAVEAVGNAAVTSRRDYLVEDTGLPPANVLEYQMEDGSSMLIRPSGTEPKIKVYQYLVSAEAPVVHEINVLMKKFEEQSAK